MKISVITVSYNSAATVVETLLSVASQSHADLEHILVDGASTDATLMLVEQHGRHVARVISGPDGGIYDAMNKGLRAASGEVVGFLNADDTFAGPDSVARIAEAFSGPSPPDFVYGDLVYARPDGRVLRRWRSGRFTPRSLHFGWMPPHPTFYFRRSLLDGIGPFDAGMRVAADYDFMVRCLKASGARVSYVPEVLVRMRTGGASNASIAAMLRKSREDLEVMRRHALGGWFTLACKNLRKLPQFLGIGASAAGSSQAPRR